MSARNHTCDICGLSVLVMAEPHKNQIVDGKTRMGPWADMCLPCHKLHGVGLGTDKGQRFDVITGQKLEG